MIKLSTSIKLAGIAVGAVLLAGGGVALAASVVPAASTSASASHSPEGDDSKSGQGKQGKDGDECGKAGASATARPTAHPTVRESEKPDDDGTAARPSSHPGTRESEKPEVRSSAKPDDADECGEGQDDDATCDMTKSAAPRPTATPGKSDESDEGCQTSQHSTGTQHSQTEGPDTHSTGQSTGDDEQRTSPRPMPTGSGHTDG